MFGGLKIGLRCNNDQGERQGKTRLLTLADLDRRTKAAQVADTIRSAIITDLGGEDRLSTLELIQAENAAMDAVVLRDMHVRWLKGEPISMTEMLSVENALNRTAAALGTSRRPRDVTTIDEYLRSQPDETTK